MHVFHWPLLGLLSLYPLIIVINSFENRVPIGKIYGCQIFDLLCPIFVLLYLTIEVPDTKTLKGALALTRSLLLWSIRKNITFMYGGASIR